MKEQFISEGYINLNKITKEKCVEALKKIKQNRNFNSDLFLSESDFKKQTVRWGTNPKPGRNLTESIELESIVDDIRNELAQILGDDFEILFPKVICGVPKNWLPKYVLDDIFMTPIPNLGVFIKPEYRDITYFYGADYHQDIIDYKDRVTDFITVYIYLDDVNENDAPLYVLPTSHLDGCKTFPHDLDRINDNTFIYNKSKEVKEVLLTGDMGTTYCWHSCLLHGTQPIKGDKERISLRLLVSRKRSIIDYCNDTINGDLKISTTRNDVDENFVPIVRKNHLVEKK
jgi:hypothetical protein